ncbi:SCO6880 family protein [Aeromicrobium sp. IC_218]|uniref:SCO6880 family protein n=1 Tax=Aeromicrobium sp. IC_218 TaxID=2545468 RepID=UPI00103B1F76|nr:SCO6880 family protein [Aeromicrobium sp. IC_218]TCI96378.1 hypothetical protein E0W78_14690 [Aeromicrobium sp. IC_218]
MSSQAVPDRPTYGNWVAQRSPGLGSLGLLATVILMGGGVVAMLTVMIAGLVAALVVAAVAATVAVAVGTPVGVTLLRRLGFARQVRRRTHQGRSGAFSKAKAPHVRLPGMLARTTLLERNDAFGNPFAVLKNPRKGGLFTIVARCVAEGPALQDQERLNQWVGGYARLLGSMSQEPALICAKTITDTAPDPGGRLESMVAQARATNSPALARQVMDECVRTYSVTSSENVTYLELTFRGRGLSRRGREDEILSELARKVPNLLAQLQSAGGGAVEMVSADELSKIVRMAYDPAAQRWLDQAEFAGEPVDVAWEEAGPVADQAAWDHYRHDSGLSVTWEMTTPPRSAINERALNGLLRPDADFVRKRVAIVYRPHSPEDSAKVSEDDAQVAAFLAGNTKRRPTAASKVQIRAAEKARDEVASGASLIQFSLLVTATVTDDEDLVQAVSTVESRAGAVPLRIRRSYGSQAAAFATTLPVGFVPWEHTTVPSNLRQYL